MTKALTHSQVESIADDLRTLLDRIEVGELDASTAMRYRIEGAIAVLDVVQGNAIQFQPEQGRLF